MSPMSFVRSLSAVGLIAIATQGVGRAPSGGSATSPGRVTPTANMSAPRMAHTATALPEGRVLVAGGFTGDERAAQSAELFDPVHRRFLPLPRMVIVRHSHTATVLPGGKVLIAGGFAAGSSTVASAELFDPLTNTFSPTGSLGGARAGHVAVLLGSGKVLLAGGVGPDWTFLASAELYDPATGRFTPTGDMTVARESHVAVRLPDGRVLIAGGHRDRRAAITIYKSAETYDAATGRFSAVGDMQVRRHKHDGVMLRDGRVLITGGADERDDGGVYRSTEFFDPASGGFTSGPEMRRPRYKHVSSTLLLANGTVLLAGGAGHAEVYDPVTRAFEIVAGDGRLAGQFSAVALLSGGSALIAGGYGNGGGPRALAWVYRP